MEATKLREVLELHGKWLGGEDGGVRARLSKADLRGANLGGANLREADLSEMGYRWAVKVLCAHADK